MPWPILAHQAPVLPLRLAYPRAYNGTALVIGSVAPDFEYLITTGPVGDGYPHSLTGQLLFCLPITLTIVLWIGGLDLGRALASRLHGRGAALAGAATDVLARGGLARAAGSALIGSFSHVVLDAVTHVWLPAVLPRGTFHVASLAFSSVALSQLVVSAALSVPSLVCLARLSRERPLEPPPPRAGLSLVGLFALAGSFAGILECLPAIRRPDDYFEAGKLYVWGDAAFHAACGAALGALIALTILSASDRPKAR